VRVGARRGRVFGILMEFRLEGVVLCRYAGWAKSAGGEEEQGNGRRKKEKEIVWRIARGVN